MTVSDFMSYTCYDYFTSVIICNLHNGDAVDVYKGYYGDIPSRYDYATVESFELQVDGTEPYICFNIDIEED